jgi:nucleotide-binding universal stress UspA family protein
MPIVCGTDFSTRSRAAAATAASFAANIKDVELWLVHVLDPATASLDSVTYDAVKEAAQERLGKEATALKERTGVRVHHMVLSGSASDTLLRFAEAKKARLVVVASQGHSESPLYRVGGTSERIAQSSPIPILVVRDAAPFESWAKNERALRVLLAVDWSRSCDGAIRWVKALRASAPVDIVASYVYYSDFTGAGVHRYGLPPRYSIVERDPETEALLERDLKSRIGELEGKGDIVYRPKHGLGRIADQLLELAEAERVDLIVVGTHHRRGLARLGSIASVTLHHSRTSVAVVPIPHDQPLAPDEVPCIRRVLVATDLSPFSNFAIPFAYTLLGQGGGEVHILHVRSPDDKRTDDVDIISELRSLVPNRGIPANVVTRTEVIAHSNASRAICETSERLGVDALCVGSHGRTGVKRAVLGSVAETIMRESTRPVLVVHPLPA